MKVYVLTKKPYTCFDHEQCDTEIIGIFKTNESALNDKSISYKDGTFIVTEYNLLD